MSQQKMILILPKKYQKNNLILRRSHDGYAAQTFCGLI